MQSKDLDLVILVQYLCQYGPAVLCVLFHPDSKIQKKKKKKKKKKMGAMTAACRNSWVTRDETLTTAVTQ